MAFTKIVTTGGSRDTISGMSDKFNNLIDDLKSTSANLGASQIGLRDASGNVSATNVEDAIAEIYTDTTTAISLTTLLGENSSTTTGLTWGYYGGNIRVDNTVTAVATGTILLTDDSTNYVEIDTTGTVSANTTSFTAGRFPIRQVVCASGSQTTSTDKRSFVHINQYATSTLKGVASFSSADFSVSSGAVSVANNTYLPCASTVSVSSAQSPYSVTAAQLKDNILFTNTGASGAVEFDLPAGASGYVFRGCITVAQYFKIVANGSEKIRWSGSQGAAGGYIRSNSVGRYIELEWNGSEWVVTKIIDSWLMDE